MLEQSANALMFYAHFIETKVGKTGLTVTVDVYRNGSEIVTAGSATEVGDGIYKYQLASGSNNAEGEYICIFKTATDTVDQQELPALWVVDKAGTENLTADLSTILADTNELQADDVPTLIAALPTAAENATGLLDAAAGVETGVTLRQGLRLMLSALAGKVSGAGTATITFRDTNDGTNRIIATVDASGNRSVVTLDAS